MATIGELIVNLRASTSAFSKDLQKAKEISFSNAVEIQRSLKVIGTSVAAGLSAAATATVALVKSTLDVADKIGKAAQTTGLSVEQYSSLAYAAELADVSQETLSKSLVILSKNLEKSNQATLEGKAAHTALSTLFRGNIPVFKSTDEAFTAIADRLSQLPDGYQKSALAAQIFGKSGAELIPLLNEGSGGLAKLRAEAAQLGVVISSKTAANAQEFNDTIKRIHTVVQALGIQLAEKLLPYLQQMGDQFLSCVKNATILQRSLDILKTTVQLVASGILVVWGALKVLGNTIGFVASAFVILNDRGLSNADKLAGIKASWEQLKDSALSSVESIRNVWTPAIQAAGKSAENASKSQLRLRDTNEGLKKSYDDVVKKLQQEILTLEAGADAALLFDLRSKSASDSQVQFVKSLQEMVKNLKEGKNIFGQQSDQKFISSLNTSIALSDKLDESMQALKEKGFQAFTDAQNNVEKYGAKLAGLNELLRSGAIDQETYNRLTQEWANTLGLVSVRYDNLHQLATNFQSAIRESFTAAITGARSFGDIMRSLLVSLEEAILKAFVFKSIFDALSGKGGILGFIGGIFGGFKAGGGDVQAGTAYVTGEKGPELFIPKTSGTIVPAGKFGGTQIIYNIDARGADPTVEFRIRRAIQESEDRAVIRSIAANREVALRTT